MIILGERKDIIWIAQRKGAAMVIDKRWCLVNDDGVLKLFPVEHYEE